MSQTHRWLPIALALSSWASMATADGGPKLPDSALFLPVGINVGAGLRTGSNGLLLGPEASLVYWRTGSWIGLYTDGLFDLGDHRQRWSIGPECGYGPFGVDAGFVTQFGDERVFGGVRVRGLLSLALLSVYGAGGYLPQHPSQQSWAEVGVLIKFPIALWMSHDRPAWVPDYPQPVPPPPMPPPPEPLPEAPTMTQPLVPVSPNAPPARPYATPPPSDNETPPVDSP